MERHTPLHLLAAELDRVRRYILKVARLVTDARNENAIAHIVSASIKRLARATLIVPVVDIARAVDDDALVTLLDRMRESPAAAAREVHDRLVLRILDRLSLAVLAVRPALYRRLHLGCFPVAVFDHLAGQRSP